MKNIIKIRLDEEHCFFCNGEILARQNENKASVLQIKIIDEMIDKWFYIEFIKPDGTKVCTPRLDVDIEKKQVVYEITNALTDQVGKIKVEIVIRDKDNLIWKSYNKTYMIIESINATERVKEENPDFIFNAQKVLNEIETLDIDIQKENNQSIITVTKKDGTQKKVEILDGEDYTLTEEDKEEIKEMVGNDIQPSIENIEETAETAISIAKGVNKSVVYNDYSELIIDFNKIKNDVYKVGQNVLIVTLNVPDLWVSEIMTENVQYDYVSDDEFANSLKMNGYIQIGYYKLSALETQKVDLTEYVTQEKFNQKLDDIETLLGGI